MIGDFPAIVMSLVFEVLIPIGEGPSGCGLLCQFTCQDLNLVGGDGRNIYIDGEKLQGVKKLWSPSRGNFPRCAECDWNIYLHLP